MFNDRMEGKSRLPLPTSFRRLLQLDRLKLNQDLTLGIGLFLIVLFSRLPFIGEILYHWDSINFAFALERFDVSVGQPHIPGYILYVLLGRAVDAIFQNPQQSLAYISMIGSASAVVAIFFLGRAFYDVRTGIIAALFLATSPLYWFYSEVALPHSFDCFVVIVSVWMFYRIAQGQAKLAIPAAIWLALAGGLRPQTQVFLLPLALYAYWQIAWVLRLISLTVLILVDFSWFLPMITMSGGFSRYFEIFRSFYLSFNKSTSIVSGGGLKGIEKNLLKLGMYTAYAWLAGAIPLLAAGLSGIRNPEQWREALRFDQRAKILLLWVIPPLAYYVFIHMGQQGLIFIFLPALILVSAASFNRLNWKRSSYRTAALLALVCINVFVFLLLPTFPVGSEIIKVLTLDTIQQHDETYLARINAVKNEFHPENTLLLSTGWRFPQYYLPEYEYLPYKLQGRWDPERGSPAQDEEIYLDIPALGVSPDSGGALYLVIFDHEIIPLIEPPQSLQWVEMNDGGRLGYLKVEHQDQLYMGPNSLGVVSKNQDGK